MSDVQSAILGPVISGVMFLGVALVPTIVVEVLVAALFGLRRRGLLAVALVNLVTNPLLNVALALVYGFGIGISQTARFVPGLGRSIVSTHVTWPFYAAFIALELFVVLAEWGLLRWALRRDGYGSGKLLALSVLMNAASASVGFWLSLPLLKL